MDVLTQRQRNGCPCPAARTIKPEADNRTKGPARDELRHATGYERIFAYIALAT